MNKVVEFKGRENVSFDGEVNLGFNFKLYRHIAAVLLIISFALNFLPIVFKLDWIPGPLLASYNILTFYFILVMNETLIDFIKKRWPDGSL